MDSLDGGGAPGSNSSKDFQRHNGRGPETDSETRLRPDWFFVLAVGLLWLAFSVGAALAEAGPEGSDRGAREAIPVLAGLILRVVRTPVPLVLAILGTILLTAIRVNSAWGARKNGVYFASILLSALYAGALYWTLALPSPAVRETLRGPSSVTRIG